MAASFYIKNGGDRAHIAGLIPYIRDSKGSLRVWFYYPEVASEGDFDQIYQDFFHTILVKGDREERILYSYIELFSAIKYFVLLNANYCGQDLKMDYYWDVSRRKKMQKSSDLDISRRQMSVRGRLSTVSESKELMKKHIERLARTIKVMNKCNEIERLFGCWSSSLLASTIDLPITPDNLKVVALGRQGFLPEIYEPMLRGFVQWIGAARVNSDSVSAVLPDFI